ncbi:hypothetical protein ACFFMS_13135 [Ectobacillus funiculus]|uniref:Uncharacterized protein n=2 Tax=Ectobacillus funiculus TaxID=137993 RepID=A0ABV5WFI4_9BACI
MANFHGPNLGYVVEQYEQYTNGTENVDPALKELFLTWGSPLSVETSHMKEIPNLYLLFLTIRQI